MKLRLFAVLSLMTVLMMSSCGKEDNVISYVEPKPENESPAGSMDIEGMDLSSYKPQKEFSLADVTLSKASYNTGKTYQKVVA